MLSSIVGKAVVSCCSMKNILQFDLESESKDTFLLGVGWEIVGRLATQFICALRCSKETTSSKNNWINASIFCKRVITYYVIILKSYTNYIYIHIVCFPLFSTEIECYLYMHNYTNIYEIQSRLSCGRKHNTHYPYL